MQKSRRLMELLLWINVKKRFTLQVMMNEFQVSRRTALRDLQELYDLGVPLHSRTGPHGGYEVLPHRILPPIAFTVDEAVSIFFAQESLGRFRTLPFQGDISSALMKFKRFLPKDALGRIEALKDRFSFSHHSLPVAAPFLERVLEASVSQKVIDITYDSKTGVTKRHIQPIGVYARNGLWYCPAYCFLRQSVREFRVDRILTLKESQDCEGLPDVTTLTLADWRKYMVEGKATHLLLEVLLTRRGVRELVSYRNFISPAPDGGSILKMSIEDNDVDYFARMFIALGSDAQVMSPLKVRERICTMVKELQDCYSTEPTVE